MNVNEIFNSIQGFDPGGTLDGLGIRSHALSQGGFAVLIITAAMGLLLCTLGLKIIRVWSVLVGFAIGMTAGASAAWVLGVPGAGVIAAGLILGIALAVLGGVLYRAGVFLTVFLAVTSLVLYVVNPRNWIAAAICLAVGLTAAIISIFFAPVLVILATSANGAVTAGSAVYYMLPVTGVLFRILLCAVFFILGLVVQLLLESRKQKKKNLEKAAQIREERSTANEVERARSMMDKIE